MLRTALFAILLSITFGAHSDQAIAFDPIKGEAEWALKLDEPFGIFTGRISNTCTAYFMNPGELYSVLFLAGGEKYVPEITLDEKDLQAEVYFDEERELVDNGRKYIQQRFAPVDETLDWRLVLTSVKSFLPNDGEHAPCQLTRYRPSTPQR